MLVVLRGHQVLHLSFGISCSVQEYDLEVTRNRASLVAGSVVENPSASAGDTRSIPDPVHAAEQLSPRASPLSLCPSGRELQLTQPACRGACSSQEKPLP